MIMHFLKARGAIAIFALGTALSGCSVPQMGVGAVDRMSAAYVETQHTYRFGAKSSGLSKSERAGINHFLRQNALRKGDVLIVTIPTSGSPRTDAGRQETMHAALSFVPSRVRIGMDQSFTTYPSVPRQTGLIRLVRASGVRVECTPGVEDLGCASAINLAVMVHEPGDVLAPAETARTARK
ncbi:CpaD family pilus assembly lipoprotein [Pseudosulfitobacter sp. DSM 107133]|jgi:type IV pilus biogenesis protein CpaD/CtpE|uniref:CpaD family pilus assembly lipoprotein n=1 Tax=Pseudosulfitobacter sp. DSM 107133 TaxID=2883100 RepID=UPI000DF16538|nr:CpaD family pilus assembly lipoprotein [Pseudosulfitobacter sp. DSM 107133]UOA25413.1 hypothetical protein DSM107133_00085 [Pseudosulfitobacter sp. DSM 107133]